MILSHLFNKCGHQMGKISNKTNTKSLWLINSPLVEGRNCWQLFAFQVIYSINVNIKWENKDFKGLARFRLGCREIISWRFPLICPCLILPSPLTRCASYLRESQNPRFPILWLCCPQLHTSVFWIWILCSGGKGQLLQIRMLDGVTMNHGPVSSPSDFTLHFTPRVLLVIKEV